MGRGDGFTYSGRVGPSEWDDSDDEPEPPPTHCNLCGANRPVAITLVRYEMGDAFALPWRTLLCQACLDPFEAGEVVQIAQRLTPEYEDFGRTAVASYLVARGAPATPIGER